MAIRLKTTPMHTWHIKNCANMADFAGFDMPLWYKTGVKAEHLAVLKSAGLFDTSHMACISVDGQEAFNLLNYCFTRNLSSLHPYRCTYGAFLNKNGYCLDDAIVYRFDHTSFMVCVNAGMGSVVVKHLEDNKKNLEINISDLTGKIGKMDIQGPDSAKILYPLIQDADLVFEEFPYFSFKGDFNSKPVEFNAVKLHNDTPILLSRSGYTGEFGFEIFLESSKALPLWEDILKIGKKFGMLACGLGARDSLRTGAGLPLSHQDIGNFKFIHHPWEFALPYNQDKTGFSKSFIGDLSLMPDSDEGYTLPFVGDSLRKINAGVQSCVLDQTGIEIGKVLSCATDMAIGHLDGNIVSINTPDLPKDFEIKGLSCGFIQISKKLPFGTPIILSEKKRKITATIVKSIRPDLSARKKISHFI